MSNLDFGLRADNQGFQQGMTTRMFGSSENQRAIDNARLQQDRDWDYDQRRFYDPLQRAEALSRLASVFQAPTDPRFTPSPGVGVNPADYQGDRRAYDQLKAQNSGQGFGMLGNLANTFGPMALDLMFPGAGTAARMVTP